MDLASSSHPTAESSQSPFYHRNSSSSDEDGLREVREDELEDLEMGNIQLDDNNVALEPENAPVAANHLNPRFNGNWEGEQSGLAKLIGLIWSVSIVFYLFCFTIAYIAVLLQRRVPCKKHIYMWATVQTIIQTVMIVNKSHLAYFVTRYVRSFDNTDPAILRRLSLLYFVNRTVNCTWMSWWLVGTVLRFSSADCEATNLQSLILVQFIIQWCLAGLVFMAMCCSFGLVAILYFCYPHAFVGGERIVGATHAQIAKLEEVKYDPEDTKVKAEDALCAICLSPYEKNNKIRFLPCKHHFHSECIDQWLLKNKSCPFCKRLIDQLDNPSAPAPDQIIDEELGLVELEPSEDQPINRPSSSNE